MIFDRNENKPVIALPGAGSMGTAIVRRIAASLIISSRTGCMPPVPIDVEPEILRTPTEKPMENPFIVEHAANSGTAGDSMNIRDIVRIITVSFILNTMSACRHGI